MHDVLWISAAFSSYCLYILSAVVQQKCSSTLLLGNVKSQHVNSSSQVSARIFFVYKGVLDQWSSK